MTKKACMICGETTSEYKIKEVPFTYKGQTIMIKRGGTQALPFSHPTHKGFCRSYFDF